MTTLHPTMPHYQDDWLTVYQGDCRDVLPTLPDASVHCVVTSPPFWGLRDYGHSDQLGLEPTPEAYVANLIAVFREVRRVLRDDGTVWLNLGDSYASSGTMATAEERNGTRSERLTGGMTPPGGRAPTPPNLKPKDLVGIPWRVAFALQADGWVLRSDIVWAKPNPMPESVTDRPTKAHEMLFLFSKGKRIGPEPTHYDDIPEGEARWLAALFDGEGSLVCRREADKGKDYGAHAAQVSIGSTSRALLDRLAAVIGEGAVLERGGQNAPMFYWQTSGKRALGLLRRIYPFLVVKQRQARCLVALEERKEIRGGHKRLDPKEIAYRDTIWRAVKELNHFGDPDLAGISEPVFGRWTEQRYYYDQEAVREAATFPDAAGIPFGGVKHVGNNGNPTYSGNLYTANGGRNLRSVWTIATRPYPGAHFAVFPPELPERCIKAGSSERGVCPECGAPWERVVEREAIDYGMGPADTANHKSVLANGNARRSSRTPTGHTLSKTSPQTIRWQPTCIRHLPYDRTEPAVVLDPFAGSGTVGLVANRLSRRAILIDLNPAYIVQQMKRNAQLPAGLTA